MIPLDQQLRQQIRQDAWKYDDEVDQELYDTLEAEAVKRALCARRREKHRDPMSPTAVGRTIRA